MRRLLALVLLLSPGLSEAADVRTRVALVASTESDHLWQRRQARRPVIGRCWAEGGTAAARTLTDLPAGAFVTDAADMGQVRDERTPVRDLVTAARVYAQAASGCAGRLERGARRPV